MKKNRFVTGFAVLAFSALVLGACGADNNSSSESSTSESSVAQSSQSSTTESTATVIAGGELQDGTYKLEEKIIQMVIVPCSQSLLKMERSLNQTMTM